VEPIFASAYFMLGLLLPQHAVNAKKIHFLPTSDSLNQYHPAIMSERKQQVQISSAPKKIAKIQFGTLTTEEIKLAAEVRVSNREVFQMPLRNAAPYGCMDPRLGISDKVSACKTCQ
jgi:hypothetical protein